MHGCATLGNTGLKMNLYLANTYSTHIFCHNLVNAAWVNRCDVLRYSAIYDSNSVLLLWHNWRKNKVKIETNIPKIAYTRKVRCPFLAHSKNELMQWRGVCLSVCKLLRKSLLLADKWPDRYQTRTRWTPGQRASRMCLRSRSRSKVTWYAHFLGFLEWATPSLTVWSLNTSVNF